MVCLQEVIPKALARWTERLQAAGYVVTASAVAPDAPRVHRDRSWKSGRHPGYRLDHILISPALTAVASAYDHSLREDGLSDHSGCGQPSARGRRLRRRE